ncbi:MAG: Sip1-related alpha-galactosidase [Phycisphaerae bacterium]
MSNPSSQSKRLMPDEENRLLLHAVPAPPIAHAYHHWDEDRRTLTYTYNNRRILTIHIPGTARVSFRHGSDGQLQSFPLFQHIYIMLSGESVAATVTFQLSHDAVNMRPSRAGPEQAIVGQVGRPLLPDANGLYDINQDMLISWFGHRWTWKSARLTPDAEGNLTATMEVELGPKTWIVNIKPHYYRTHLGYQYHRPWERRPSLVSIAGWCTWEAYRREVAEEKVLEATEFFAKHLRPYGLEYIQIDDGFEKLPFPSDPNKTVAEAWLETNDEFPSGHGGVVQKIKQCGLQPGIWTTSSIYNDEWADAQPEFLLKDQTGEPFLGDWIKYILDCTPEALDKHVRPYFQGLREAGYTYFKIDGIRHLLYDGLQEAVLRGLMTNDEAEKRFRRFLECGREGLGKDAFWLSSWGVLSQMVGLCDACRIAQDAMPTWAGMQMQLVESARWFFTHRVLYQNDPDHVCVRAPFEWSRSVLSLVSLTGQLFMLSDALEEYDEERLRLIQRCIPPLTTMTAETAPLDSDYAAFTWTKFHGFHVLDESPFAAETMTDEEARNQAGEWETINDDHPFSSLWAIHLDTPVGRWCVAGRFAALPLRASTLKFANLALDRQQDYLVFDFWKQEYLGRFSGEIVCPPLPLGHCQILAIRPALDRPQLLSSSRHVSQDAVSVRAQSWANNELTLKLDGVSGTSERYWIHVPHAFRLVRVAGEGIKPEAGRFKTVDAPDGALPIQVAFPAGDSDRTLGRLAVYFARR